MNWIKLILIVSFLIILSINICNKNILATFPNLPSSNSSAARDSASSHATTISFDPQNIDKDKLYLTKTPIQSDTKENKTILKQTLKSRLTRCQLILLILNFVGIIAFIILIAIFAKTKHSTTGIFIRRQ